MVVECVGVDQAWTHTAAGFGHGVHSQAVPGSLHYFPPGCGYFLPCPLCDRKVWTSVRGSSSQQQVVPVPSDCQVAR